MTVSLILASKSPVRAALLRQAGLEFDVAAARLDEREIEAEAGDAPKALAMRLARAKGAEVAGHRPGALVIGADQILEIGGQVLHKPGDMPAAMSRLQALRGRTHHLHTAVTLTRGGDRLWSHTETAALTMHDLSDAELAGILTFEGEAALQSVGAYRLEGPAIRLFARISGDYFAMLGLPLLALLTALREFAPEQFEDPT